MLEYSKDFPIFKNNPELVYLDNASTTQKPKQVIDSITDFYSIYNSNVHRGFYHIADVATKAFEKARETIAEFINAQPDEIIFTSGVTESLNTIAMSLAVSGFIATPPRIISTDLEHHSNFLPWQQLTPEVIQFIPSTQDFILDQATHLMKNADILALTHASNVTGTITDIKSLIYSNPHPYSIVDASQTAGHIPIDVKKLHVDFLVFSGHKMYGPMGIGVMYIKKEILRELLPIKLGGGMVDKVQREVSTYVHGPTKFEGGTPNIVGAVGLATAIEFIEKLGFDEITKHEQDLRTYCFQRLHEIDDIDLYHPNPENHEGLGVISFAHKTIHAHDLAQHLGDNNVAVRAGHHCAQILHNDVLDIPATVRVSFGMYNNKEEIDVFIKQLMEAINVFET